MSIKPNVISDFAEGSSLVDYVEQFPSKEQQ